MKRRVVLLAMLCICAARPATAQLTIVSRDLAANRPGWLPRYVTTPMELNSGLTGAQVAAARETLEKIQRILMQIPELAQPTGFEIKPNFHGGGRRRGLNDGEMPGAIVTYGLNLYFFAPTEAIAGEGCTCIEVVVNRGDLRDRLFDEQGRPFSIEQTRGDPMPLATYVYLDEFSFDDRTAGLPADPEEQGYVQVVLTTSGELPWRPVTREEYYKASILQHVGRNGATRAEVREQTGRTPYERWLADAPRRKAEREAALRDAAKVQSPAENASLRKSLEDAEREMAASFKASAAVDRENQQSDMRGFLAIEDSMRAELARMSPAERNMPVLIDRVGVDGPHATGRYITDRDERPTTFRILTPNFDFWRPRKSPVDVRSITVTFWAWGTGLVPAVRHALGQAFEKMDWAALHALLDEPRR